MIRSAIVCMLLALPLLAQVPLSWTPMNADPQLAGGVSDSILFDDGQGEQLYVVGNFDGIAGAPANSVARYDGMRWEGLSAPLGGARTISTLAVFDEGNGDRLFMGGLFSGPGVIPGGDNILRFDGTSFSAVGGGVDGGVSCLEVYDDGTGPSLYAGGRFTSAGGVVTPQLARWNGAQWFSVGGGIQVSPIAGVPSSVSALKVYGAAPARRLAVGGRFDVVGNASVPAGNIASWDGTTWTSIGVSGTLGIGEVQALVEFDGGNGPELIAGGGVFEFPGFSSQIPNRIRRFDGTQWVSLGLGIDPLVNVGLPSMPRSRVYDLEVFDDGNGTALHVGGFFSGAGGINLNHWARWDGQAWTTPPGQVYGTILITPSIFTLLPLPASLGGGVVVGGSFGSTGMAAHSSLARWTPTGIVDLGTATGVLASAPSAFINQLSSYTDASGSSLAVSGRFRALGGVVAPSLAQWDGTVFAPLGDGASAQEPFVVLNDGVSDVLLQTGLEGVRQLQNNAMMAVGPFAAAGAMVTTPRTIAFADYGSGPELYAAGRIDGGASGGLSPFVFRFNGGVWQPLPLPPTPTGFVGPLTGFIPFSLLSWDDGTGPALYLIASAQVAGSNQNFNSGLFRWDGTAWQFLSLLRHGSTGPLATGFPQTIVGGDPLNPSIYVSGTFGGIPNLQPYGFARWDGTQWIAVGPLVPNNRTVRGLVSHDSGDGPQVFAFGDSGFGDGTVWALDASSWRVVSEDPIYSMFDMASYDDGGGADLYCAITYTTPQNGRDNDILRSSSCMDSQVGSAVGIPVPVLGAAIGTGPVSTPRSMAIPIGQSFTIGLAQPQTTALPAVHALVLFVGEPGTGAASIPGFGDVCLPLPPLMGSTWLASAGIGINGLIPAATAPWSFSVIGGIPFPATATIQGVIADDSSPLGASLTNGLALRFR